MVLITKIGNRNPVNKVMLYGDDVLFFQAKLNEYNKDADILDGW